jgi:hypothetical protein
MGTFDTNEQLLIREQLPVIQPLAGSVPAQAGVK